VSNPRSPGRAARPAWVQAEGRSGDRAREPQPDPRADVQDPGLDPPDRRRGRDAARGPSPDARGLLRDDRLPGRASLLTPAAHVAARDDRDRDAPGPVEPRGEERAALQAGPGVPVRALP